MWTMFDSYSSPIIPYMYVDVVWYGVRDTVTGIQHVADVALGSESGFYR